MPRRFKLDSIPNQGTEEQNKRTTSNPLQEERSLGDDLACETNEAMVFDSSFDSVDNETKSVIKNIFENDGQIKISMQKMQKQSRPNDCGLFAIE